MTDLLYRRYSNPQELLSLEAEDGILLLEYALEKEEDALIFSRWVQGAQYTMSFDSFKASLARKPEKPAEEVLEYVGNILQAFEQERGE